MGLHRGVWSTVRLVCKPCPALSGRHVSFVERTDFEAGFAAQWDSHLAPVIAAVRSRHRRQLAFGGFVTLIGTGVIGAGAVMWLSDITLGPRFALLDQPVFAALIAALAALAMIGNWVPLITRKDSYDEPLEAAMRAHLAGAMEPCNNSGFAALLVAELPILRFLPLLRPISSAIMPAVAVKPSAYAGGGAGYSRCQTVSGGCRQAASYGHACQHAGGCHIDDHDRQQHSAPVGHAAIF